jgi:glutathione synthase/RimK-type ligase-like ATP-grasp enzyme
LTRVALVSAESARHLDEDLPPLVRALAAIGAEPSVEVWDDPAVDWAAFDLVVVRSTWDYVPRRDALLAWSEAVAAVTVLANPPDVLRWSTDKRYLAELSSAGVPCVATAFFEPGDDVELYHVGDDDELVVKPAIGAGSVDAERFPPERRAAALDHVSRLLGEGRTAMVQPYLPAVDHDGETALVFFAGELNHAVRKGSILRPDGTVFVEGLYAEEEITLRRPTEAEVALARAALDAVPGCEAGPLLYARVDVVLDGARRPVVLELELAEPSVFLTFAEGSAERFAAAILRRAGGTAPQRPR